MRNIHDLRILNLDETAREWIDYDIPKECDVSKPFDTWEEAQEELDRLNDLNRDMSVYIGLRGTYILNDHYIQLVYTYKTLNS